MTTPWRKSTFSADNASCVKIRFDGPHVLLGDTKNDESILRVSAIHWAWTLSTPGRLR